MEYPIDLFNGLGNSGLPSTLGYKASYNSGFVTKPSIEISVMVPRTRSVYI